MSSRRIRVTLVKSKHGRGAKQLACVHGLGLRRIHQTVELEETPAVIGMVNKISHLVRVEVS